MVTDKIEYTIPFTCLLFVLLLDFRSCTGLVSRDKTIHTDGKIAKRFSNPRKEGTPCDGDGKRK